MLGDLYDRQPTMILQMSFQIRRKRKRKRKCKSVTVVRQQVVGIKNEEVVKRVRNYTGPGASVRLYQKS